MKFQYILLLSIGIFAAVFGLCRFLVWRWENYESAGDDERQLEVQGKAAKAAFGILLAYFIGVLALRLFQLELSAEDYDSVLWLGVMLGVAVYSTITIWLDAYAGLRVRWRIVVVVLLALSGLLLGDLLDGVLTLHGPFVHVNFWLKIAAGVFFLYLALLVLVRMKLNEKE